MTYDRRLDILERKMDEVKDELSRIREWREIQRDMHRQNQQWFRGLGVGLALTLLSQFFTWIAPHLGR